MDDINDATRENAGLASSLETLARDTDTPLELVDNLYNAECADLERDARISLYIPVLAQRRVKSILKSRRGAYQSRAA